MPSPDRKVDLKPGAVARVSIRSRHFPDWPVRLLEYDPVHGLWHCARGVAGGPDTPPPWPDCALNNASTRAKWPRVALTVSQLVAL